MCGFKTPPVNLSLREVAGLLSLSVFRPRYIKFGASF